MKKLLSLMLLCMVCMAAWADRKAEPALGLGGKVYQIKAYWHGNTTSYPLVVENSSVKVVASGEDAGTYFVLCDRGDNFSYSLYTADGRAMTYSKNVAANNAPYPMAFFSTGRGDSYTWDGYNTTDPIYASMNITHASYSVKVLGGNLDQYTRTQDANNIFDQNSQTYNGTNYTTDFLLEEVSGYTAYKVIAPNGITVSTDITTIAQGNNGYVVVNGDATVNSFTCNNGTVQKVDNENKAVIINGAVEYLQTRISSINQNRVGYPKKSSIEEKYQSLFDSEINESNIILANELVSSLLVNSDINLPQDGKAYTIKAVYSSGEDMLYYDTSISKIKGTTNPANGYIFICRKTGDGKFLFVNEYGKFLTWGSSTSVNTVNASAVVDEYSEYADITIRKATARTDGTGNDVNNERRFGLVTLQAFKQGTTDLWYSNYIHGHATNNFVESGSTSKWYDGNGNRTHMFRIEEAENPYQVKISNPNPDGSSSLDNKYVGTFSAPYDVELNGGVKAYKAAYDGSVVTFTEVGSIVPKNQGVLLYKEDADANITTNSIPATSASVDMSGNIFAAAVKYQTVNEDDYVLGFGSKGVMFYARETAIELTGKAYIPATSLASGVSVFRFDFDEQTTGISAAQTTSDNGVAYDLAGRRINANAKGISIVNGKKVIR